VNTPFEIAFPGFVQATVDLYRSLLPWSIPILVIGYIVDFWHGVPTPFELMKTLVKTFLVLILLAQSHHFINAGQMAVKTWTERSIPARPENVARRFQEKLAAAQESRETKDESFIDQLFSSRSVFEAIIFAILTLISWLAMGVMAFVYSVQRALLLGCWSIAPLLFPFLAIRPLSHIGLRHVLRLLGIILWPIGLALAATFSEGLIDVIASGTSFAGASTTEALGRGLTSLLGLVVLAIWLILSSLIAPLIIQRLLVGAEGPALILAGGGQVLAQGIPSFATISSAARSTVQFGQSFVSNITDSFKPAQAAGVDRLSLGLPSPQPRQTSPPEAARATPPSSAAAAEQAVQAIVEKTRKR
jgi:hypothetical protein